VEDIVDKRKVGKRFQYLVKWEGFPHDQNTWEPISNLTNVKDFVTRLNQKLEFDNLQQESTAANEFS